MPNGTYGGVRGRKTKVGRKLLRFPPTRCKKMLKFPPFFVQILKSFVQYPEILCTTSEIFCTNFA